MMAAVHQIGAETPPPQPLVEDVAQSLGRDLRWPRQPYPGLRPFNVTQEADESLIFYGREEQKDEILARLNRAHVVFVIGPSGCGKSSLIKAGVIPALNAGLLTRAGHRWRCARMRPGRRPLAGLAEVLAPLLPEAHGSLEKRRAAIEQLAREEDSALWLLADAMAPQREGEPLRRGRVLLILDQLEELFTPEIERGEEVMQLVRLLTRFFERPHEDLYLILVMRTDYIGRCASYPHLAEMLNRTQYLTPVLDPAQLTVAITRPAEAYGGRVEPALVEVLLEDMAALREGHADQLPLLQHALFWLWEQAWRRSGLSEPPRPGQGEMRGVSELALEDYRKQGGLRGILNAHAEIVFVEATADGPDERLRSLCEGVFKRLSQRDLEHRYRRAPATLEELAGATGAGREAVLAVLRPFMAPDASFLELHETAREGEKLVDISHESLIRQWDRLREWAEQEAQSAESYWFLEQNARLWKEGRAALWGTPNLENALNWKEGQQPTAVWARRYGGDFALAMEFLDASEQAHVTREAELQNQRQRELQQAQRLAESEQKRAEDQEAANKRLRVFAGVLGVSLAAAGVLAFYAWEMRDQATIAHGIARNALQNAETALDHTLNSNHVMVQLFYDRLGNLIAIPTKDIERLLPSVKEAVDTMGQVSGDIAAHPKFLNTRASLLNLFSDLYARQGEFGRALEQAEAAIEIMNEAEPTITKTTDGDLQRNEWLDNLVESYNRIVVYGEYLYSLNQLHQAAEKAIEYGRLLVQASPDLEWRRDLVLNYSNLFSIHLASNQKDDAKIAMDTMRAESKLLESSNALEDQQVLARLYSDMAHGYAQLGEAGHTLELFRLSLSKMKELADQNIGDAAHAEALAVVHGSFGDYWLREAKNADAALAEFNEALKWANKLVEIDSANATWQLIKANLLVGVGDTLADQGKNSQAIQTYSESRRLWEELIDRTEGNIRAYMGLLYSQNRLVFVRQKHDDYETALREAHYGTEKALKPLLTRLGNGYCATILKPSADGGVVKETDCGVAYYGRR